MGLGLKFNPTQPNNWCLIFLVIWSEKAFNIDYQITWFKLSEVNKKQAQSDQRGKNNRGQKIDYRIKL